VVWKKQIGEVVMKEEYLGDIVSLDGSVSGKRTPVYSPIEGRILVQPLIKLVRTGQRVALVAGMTPLTERRAGNLLLNF